MFYKLIVDPSMLWVAAVCLLVAEIFVNIVVIQRIPYTEIDWKAYMQEVEGVNNGTFDYLQLKGDTGPLVYPAGFVYIYLALYYITRHGENIRLGQCLFAVFYLLTLLAVFRIYHRSRKIPPYALVFMCVASYRIHSIFVLRLFNDPIAMLLFYLSVNAIISQRWSLGCILFSAAVSVKMNILLFAPGLFIIMFSSQGMWKTALNLILCASVQVLLALPFLLSNPLGYIIRAFDLKRVFLFKWTVNWRFLPEEVFVNPVFHYSLLILHAAVLLLFCITHWWRYLKLSRETNKSLNFSVNAIVMPLFTANFIGITFSRSLHYQFYVWYYHTLPYLLWSTSFPSLAKIGLLGVIELAWNTYPSTTWSSASLHLCHFIILTALWRNPPTPQLIRFKKTR